MSTPLYGWLMLTGILVSALLWARTARRDRRLPLVYFAALLGAFVGAKIVYLLAEGWRDVGQPDMWLRLATGKTILGGLLLGYLGVEVVKRAVGYREPTGDWFAFLTPIGIALGRVGCWLQGCCPGLPCRPAWYARVDASGIPRWPAVPVELAFNLAALAVLALLRTTGRCRGQLFHLYLIGYGGFRFLHEFARDTPRILGPLSGYHFAALAVLALGAIRYRQRARAAARRPSPAAEAAPWAAAGNSPGNRDPRGRAQRAHGS